MKPGSVVVSTQHVLCKIDPQTRIKESEYYEVDGTPIARPVENPSDMHLLNLDEESDAITVAAALVGNMTMHHGYVNDYTLPRTYVVGPEIVQGLLPVEEFTYSTDLLDEIKRALFLYASTLSDSWQILFFCSGSSMTEDVSSPFLVQLKINSVAKSQIKAIVYLTDAGPGPNVLSKTPSGSVFAKSHWEYVKGVVRELLGFYKRVARTDPGLYLPSIGEKQDVPLEIPEGVLLEDTRRYYTDAQMYGEALRKRKDVRALTLLDPTNIKFVSRFTSTDSPVERVEVMVIGTATKKPLKAPGPALQHLGRHLIFSHEPFALWSSTDDASPDWFRTNQEMFDQPSQDAIKKFDGTVDAVFAGQAEPSVLAQQALAAPNLQTAPQAVAMRMGLAVASQDSHNSKLAQDLMRDAPSDASAPQLDPTTETVVVEVVDPVIEEVAPEEKDPSSEPKSDQTKKTKSDEKPRKKIVPMQVLPEETRVEYMTLRERYVRMKASLDGMVAEDKKGEDEDAAESEDKEGPADLENEETAKASASVRKALAARLAKLKKRMEKLRVEQLPAGESDDVSESDLEMQKLLQLWDENIQRQADGLDELNGVSVDAANASTIPIIGDRMLRPQDLLLFMTVAQFPPPDFKEDEGDDENGDTRDYFETLPFPMFYRASRMHEAHTLADDEPSAVARESSILGVPVGQLETMYREALIGYAPRASNLPVLDKLRGFEGIPVDPTMFGSDSDEYALIYKDQLQHLVELEVVLSTVARSTLGAVIETVRRGRQDFAKIVRAASQLADERIKKAVGDDFENVGMYRKILGETVVVKDTKGVVLKTTKTGDKVQLNFFHPKSITVKKTGDAEWLATADDGKTMSALTIDEETGETIVGNLAIAPEIIGFLENVDLKAIGEDPQVLSTGLTDSSLELVMTSDPTTRLVYLEREDTGEKMFEFDPSDETNKIRIITTAAIWLGAKDEEFLESILVDFAHESVAQALDLGLRLRHILSRSRGIIEINKSIAEKMKNNEVDPKNVVEPYVYILDQFNAGIRSMIQRTRKEGEQQSMLRQASAKDLSAALHIFQFHFAIVAAHASVCNPRFFKIMYSAKMECPYAYINVPGHAVFMPTAGIRSCLAVCIDYYNSMLSMTMFTAQIDKFIADGSDSLKTLAHVRDNIVMMIVLRVLNATYGDAKAIGDIGPIVAKVINKRWALVQGRVRTLLPGARIEDGVFMYGDADAKTFDDASAKTKVKKSFRVEPFVSEGQYVQLVWTTFYLTATATVPQMIDGDYYQEVVDGPPPVFFDEAATLLWRAEIAKLSDYTDSDEQNELMEQLGNNEYEEESSDDNSEAVRKGVPIDDVKIVVAAPKIADVSHSAASSAAIENLDSLKGSSGNVAASKVSVSINEDGKIKVDTGSSLYPAFGSELDVVPDIDASGQNHSSAVQSVINQIELGGDSGASDAASETPEKLAERNARDFVEQPRPKKKKKPKRVSVDDDDKSVISISSSGSRRSTRGASKKASERISASKGGKVAPTKGAVMRSMNESIVVDRVIDMGVKKEEGVTKYPQTKIMQNSRIARRGIDTVVRAKALPSAEFGVLEDGNVAEVAIDSARNLDLLESTHLCEERATAMINGLIAQHLAIVPQRLLPTAASLFLGASAGRKAAGEDAARYIRSSIFNSGVDLAETAQLNSPLAVRLIACAPKPMSIDAEGNLDPLTRELMGISTVRFAQSVAAIACTSVPIFVDRRLANAELLYTQLSTMSGGLARAQARALREHIDEARKSLGRAIQFFEPGFMQIRAPGSAAPVHVASVPAGMSLDDDQERFADASRIFRPAGGIPGIESPGPTETEPRAILKTSLELLLYMVQPLRDLDNVLRITMHALCSDQLPRAPLPAVVPLRVDERAREIVKVVSHDVLVDVVAQTSGRLIASNMASWGRLTGGAETDKGAKHLAQAVRLASPQQTPMFREPQRASLDAIQDLFASPVRDAIARTYNSSSASYYKTRHAEVVYALQLLSKVFDTSEGMYTASMAELGATLVAGMRANSDVEPLAFFGHLHAGVAIQIVLPRVQFPEVYRYAEYAFVEVQTMLDTLAQIPVYKEYGQADASAYFESMGDDEPTAGVYLLRMHGAVDAAEMVTMMHERAMTMARDFDNMLAYALRTGLAPPMPALSVNALLDLHIYLTYHRSWSGSAPDYLQYLAGRSRFYNTAASLDAESQQTALTHWMSTMYSEQHFLVDDLFYKHADQFAVAWARGGSKIPDINTGLATARGILSNWATTLPSSQRPYVTAAIGNDAWTKWLMEKTLGSKGRVDFMKSYGAVKGDATFRPVESASYLALIRRALVKLVVVAPVFYSQIEEIVAAQFGASEASDGEVIPSNDGPALNQLVERRAYLLRESREAPGTIAAFESSFIVRTPVDVLASGFGMNGDGVAKIDPRTLIPDPQVQGGAVVVVQPEVSILELQEAVSIAGFEEGVLRDQPIFARANTILKTLQQRVSQLSTSAQVNLDDLDAVPAFKSALRTLAMVELVQEKTDEELNLNDRRAEINAYFDGGAGLTYSFDNVLEKVNGLIAPLEIPASRVPRYIRDFYDTTQAEPGTFDQAVRRRTYAYKMVSYTEDVQKAAEEAWESGDSETVARLVRRVCVADVQSVDADDNALAAWMEHYMGDAGLGPRAGMLLGLHDLETVAQSMYGNEYAQESPSGTSTERGNTDRRGLAPVHGTPGYKGLLQHQPGELAFLFPPLDGDYRHDGVRIAALNVSPDRLTWGYLGDMAVMVLSRTASGGALPSVYELQQLNEPHSVYSPEHRRAHARFVSEVRGYGTSRRQTYNPFRRAHLLGGHHEVTAALGVPALKNPHYADTARDIQLAFPNLSMREKRNLLADYEGPLPLMRSAATVNERKWRASDVEVLVASMGYASEIPAIVDTVLTQYATIRHLVGIDGDWEQDYIELGLEEVVQTDMRNRGVESFDGEEDDLDLSSPVFGMMYAFASRNAKPLRASELREIIQHRFGQYTGDVDSLRRPEDIHVDVASMLTYAPLYLSLYGTIAEFVEKKLAGDNSDENQGFFGRLLGKSSDFFNSIFSSGLSRAQVQTKIKEISVFFAGRLTRAVSDLKTDFVITKESEDRRADAIALAIEYAEQPKGAPQTHVTAAKFFNTNFVTEILNEYVQDLSDDAIDCPLTSDNAWIVSVPLVADESGAQSTLNATSAWSGLVGLVANNADDEDDDEEEEETENPVNWGTAGNLWM